MGLINIFKFMADLVRKGCVFHFVRILCADRSNIKLFRKIETSCQCMMRKFSQEESGYFLALECLAEANMYSQNFEVAASLFDELFELKKQQSLVLSSNAHSFYCHAVCYFNLGNREKVIEIIKDAIMDGVKPEIFDEMLDVDRFEKGSANES